MVCVHLTPNLEASHVLSGFYFSLVNLFGGILRTYPVGVPHWLGPACCWD